MQASSTKDGGKSTDFFEHLVSLNMFNKAYVDVQHLSFSYLGDVIGPVPEGEEFCYKNSPFEVV